MVRGLANVIAFVALLIIIIGFMIINNIQSDRKITEMNDSLQTLITVNEKNVSMFNELLEELRNKKGREGTQKKEDEFLYTPPQPPCCGCGTEP